MRGKELINDMIYTYFMLVTMIVGVMLVLGVYFMPEKRFGYEIFGAPLVYAAFGTLPNLVMYAKKELTLRQLIIRKIIQLVLVEVIVIAVAVPVEIFETRELSVVIALAISICLVFVFTHVLEWFQDSIAAKKMTEELMQFQNSHKEDRNESNNT